MASSTTIDLNSNATFARNSRARAFNATLIRVSGRFMWGVLWMRNWLCLMNWWRSWDYPHGILRCFVICIHGWANRKFRNFNSISFFSIILVEILIIKWSYLLKIRLSLKKWIKKELQEGQQCNKIWVSYNQESGRVSLMKSMWTDSWERTLSRREISELRWREEVRLGSERKKAKLGSFRISHRFTLLLT